MGAPGSQAALASPPPGEPGARQEDVPGARPGPGPAPVLQELSTSGSEMRGCQLSSVIKTQLSQRLFLPSAVASCNEDLSGALMPQRHCKRQEMSLLGVFGCSQLCLYDIGKLVSSLTWS